MELQDYSGEFKPDLKMTDFSKEALMKLVEVCARDYVGMDGIWNTLVKKAYGVERANEFERDVWARENSPGTLMDIKRLVEAFNIKGDDVATVFKFLQLTPVLGIYLFEHDHQLINRNHGILTVTRCPSLEYFERHGDAAMAKFVCCEIDDNWIRIVARHFNPKITITGIGDLPRKCKADVPCKWEFKLKQ